MVINFPKVGAKHPPVMLPTLADRLHKTEYLNSSRITFIISLLQILRLSKTQSKLSMTHIKFFFKTSLLCSVMNLAQADGHSKEPVVKIWNGKLSGMEDKTSAGNTFYKFLGVPYAEPPIKTLRFRDPMAKKSWSGTLNATELGDECVQYATSPQQAVILSGSEDCLFLNVFTPNLPNKDHSGSLHLMPVMFWIHGGGFTSGNGVMNPEFLLDSGVLVVSVNYRLGPFGFFALEDNPDLAGNLGLKDQQEALMWVHNNIKYFGGDPNKVTLFGESAGAVSVHAHVLSPRIKNIFHGAILQSGTLLLRYDSYFLENEVQGSSKRLLKKLGCEVHDAVNCLQGKDVEALMQFSNGTEVLADEEEEEMDDTSYWAVQDTCSFSPVLPYNPLHQLTAGSFKKVPMIAGTTKDDGGIVLLLAPQIKTAFDLDESNKTLTLGSTLGLAMRNITEEEKLLAEIVTRFYLSDGSYEDNEKNLLQMLTDSWFASPAFLTAHLHGHEAPAYPYVLNERCTVFSFSFVYGGGLKDYGVSHADDLLCIFQPFPAFGNQTEAGAKVSKAMVDTWTNFAKFGNPSPYMTSKPDWPMNEVMFFEEESGLKKNETQQMSFQARMMFWDKMYWIEKEENAKYTKYPTCMVGTHHHQHHHHHHHHGYHSHK